MFSLIINTMFVLIKSLRKINSCLNWKVEIPIHLVWFTIVHVLVKSHELARLSETFKLDDKNIIHWKIQTLQSTWKIFQLIIYLEVLPLTSPKRPIGQNMKASTIALKQPSFNKQAESKKLLLFQNGVTQ